MQTFHFSWVHKPGKFNVADPLSRNSSFKAIALVLAVATRRQAQAQQTADTPDPVAAAPEFAPAAKRRKRNDHTAVPATEHTGPDHTETDHAELDTAGVAGKIAEAYAADPVFADPTRTRKWTFTDKLWWDHNEIMVPDNKELKRMIMHEFHDSAYAGHLGLRKTV